jgi:hypothetical protein
MPESTITDTTKPNGGRIYDYLLGGHHNFEVDRQAADQLLKVLPFLPKSARLQRWCLQDLAAELTEKRGFDIIIDFASGLPTQDHLHTVVPEGTTIIYSDRDPVTAEYGREILGDVPNLHYFQADARRPEELLNRREVQEILKGRRDVALIYWGVSSFFADEDISHVARYLYDWADDKKSCWVFQAQGSTMNANDPSFAQMIKIYEQMGEPIRVRSLEKYEQLVLPWHADGRGFVTVLEWHGFNENDLSPEDQKAFGKGGGGHGAYLVK